MMGIWQEWLWPAGLIAAAAIVAQVAHRVGFALFDRLTRRTALTWDNAAVRRMRGPARLALTLFAILLVMPDAPMGMPRARRSTMPSPSG